MVVVVVGWVGHLRKSGIHGARRGEGARRGGASARAAQGTQRVNDGCLSCWKKRHKQSAVGTEACEEVEVCVPVVYLFERKCVCVCDVCV